MSSASDTRRLVAAGIAAIPEEAPDPITWAESCVRFPKSARSERFDSTVSPWTREVVLRQVDGVTRRVTYVKPVQCGGSAAGEVMLLYRMHWGRGYLQYNWQNDKRSDDRWASRIDELIDACQPVRLRREMLPKDKNVKCQIDFGNVFFQMQGAFVPENLASDTVRYQINEEIHLWEPGHLELAYGRVSAVWNYVIFNVSNASKKGDQLHRAYLEGTQQLWEVCCPGCRKYHIMRTRWDERHPELGGLRYDADGCRYDDGSYNYNKLEPTIRYQMPCGQVVRDSSIERRALSLSGRYSEPTNPGAPLKYRSYTLDAVAVDYISWLELIQQKHRALFARRHGDPEPWRKYVTERECNFFDPDDVPIAGRIVLSSDRKKTREGLPERAVRLFALDRQQGESAKGEFPHWWLVIRDFDAMGNSLLVFEGKLETDEQVLAVLDDHKCPHHHGVADSGDDTTHVYLFCLKNGINAIKGGGEAFYAHPNGARRIYSPERPLHRMINRESLYPYIPNGEGEMVPDPREPLFWFYSKSGIRERLAWLRASTKWEVPGDVSHDYQSHMESEELRIRKHPRTGEEIREFVQLKTRNDLYVCEAYIAMQAEMAGLIGAEAGGAPYAKKAAHA